LPQINNKLQAQISCNRNAFAPQIKIRGCPLTQKNHEITKSTVVLHAVIGIGFIALLAFGWYMTGLPKSDFKFELYAWHKSFGVILLLLALIKFGLFFKQGLIKPISTLARWESILSHSVKMLLLLWCVVMPISGICMSVGGGHGVSLFGLELIAKVDKIPWLGSLGGAIHNYSLYPLIALILLHTAGAFKHELIDKDGTLKRILGMKY
jgi:cytochrome b561